MACRAIPVDLRTEVGLRTNQKHMFCLTRTHFQGRGVLRVSVPSSSCSCFLCLFLESHSPRAPLQTAGQIYLLARDSKISRVGCYVACLQLLHGEKRCARDTLGSAPAKHPTSSQFPKRYGWYKRQRKEQRSREEQHRDARLKPEHGKTQKRKKRKACVDSNSDSAADRHEAFFRSGHGARARQSAGEKATSGQLRG